MAQPFDQNVGDARSECLTEELRARYREMVGEEGPSEDEVLAAIRTLGAAWSQVAGAVEAASRHGTVRHHLMQAVASVGEAATAFVEEMSRPEAGGDTPGKAGG